jgi:hypothetical protein
MASRDDHAAAKGQAKTAVKLLIIRLGGEKRKNMSREIVGVCLEDAINFHHQLASPIRTTFSLNINGNNLPFSYRNLRFSRVIFGLER